MSPQVALSGGLRMSAAYRLLRGKTEVSKRDQFDAPEAHHVAPAGQYIRSQSEVTADMVAKPEGRSVIPVFDLLIYVMSRIAMICLRVIKPDGSGSPDLSVPSWPVWPRSPRSGPSAFPALRKSLAIS